MGEELAGIVKLIDGFYQRSLGREESSETFGFSTIWLNNLVYENWPAIRAALEEWARLEKENADLVEQVGRWQHGVLELEAALRELATAVEPEEDAGEICRVCMCTMPEFEEAHVAGCAYVKAKALLAQPAAPEVK